jgi:hypothetical protein
MLLRSKIIWLSFQLADDRVRGRIEAGCRSIIDGLKFRIE